MTILSRKISMKTHDGMDCLSGVCATIEAFGPRRVIFVAVVFQVGESPVLGIPVMHIVYVDVSRKNIVFGMTMLGVTEGYRMMPLFPAIPMGIEMVRFFVFTLRKPVLAHQLGLGKCHHKIHP